MLQYRFCNRISNIHMQDAHGLEILRKEHYRHVLAMQKNAFALLGGCDAALNG